MAPKSNEDKSIRAVALHTIQTADEFGTKVEYRRGDVFSTTEAELARLKRTEAAREADEEVEEEVEVEADEEAAAAAAAPVVAKGKGK